MHENSSHSHHQLENCLPNRRRPRIPHVSATSVCIFSSHPQLLSPHLGVFSVQCWAVFLSGKHRTAHPPDHPHLPPFHLWIFIRPHGPCLTPRQAATNACRVNMTLHLQRWCFGLRLCGAIQMPNLLLNNTIISLLMCIQFVSVGLPGQQKLYVRRSHMRPEPHHDELHTFRRETEPRRHCRNEGWIRAVVESHCRHDMMMIVNVHSICHWRICKYGRTSGRVLTPWISSMHTSLSLYCYIRLSLHGLQAQHIPLIAETLLRRLQCFLMPSPPV